MIDRYTRKEMAKIWAQEEKFNLWLRIELLACEAWKKLGIIPDKDFRKIKNAKFNMERIAEIEKTVKHDVVSFLTAVSESTGESSRFVHFGLTSSDVLDTSLAVQLKNAAGIIIKDVEELLSVLKTLAFKYKNTPVIGRTHGVHAEPTTFGLRFAIWYGEMKRNLKRLKSAKDEISYGKISGAVGTFANIEPEVEKYVCDNLGLKPEPVSTQIVQRDRHAQFFCMLAILASSIEKIALEIRHLQRTEVLEAEEPFTSGQKGSSAMPHKRNPIISENLCGLARLVRSYSISAMENVPLWHERDISHSSVERVIGPDATILIDYMLVRLTGLLKDIVVYPEKMKKNLEITKGLVFSERILLELIKKGITREAAYGIVQTNAMETWKSGSEFRDLIKNDKKIRSLLSNKEIERCFDLKHHLRNVDTIFKRAF
ncbi:MAG TPA: adenylosuccinate lyase, partial [bacterium]